MILPNRSGSVGSYRYGFNGKEKDDEVKGQGVQYDYGFRVYDARLGKFLSTDPLFKGYPWYTPYQFAGNNPVWAIDIDGLEELRVTKTKHVIKSVIIQSNGERPQGDVMIIVNGKKKKVTVGTVIKTPGYPGSEELYDSHYYTQIAKPSINGIRQFKIRRIFDSLVPAKLPPPVVPENPKDETIPELNTIREEDIKRRTETKIKDELPPKTDTTKDVPATSYKTIRNTITIDIPFVGDKPEFENYWGARNHLDPILDKLKEHPDNKLKITVNVKATGPKSLIERNFFSANYLAEDLAADRKKLLEDFIESYNVDMTKVEIDHTFNSQKTFKLDAVLTTVEQVKN